MRLVQCMTSIRSAHLLLQPRPGPLLQSVPPHLTQYLLHLPFLLTCRYYKVLKKFKIFLKSTYRQKIPTGHLKKEFLQLIVTMLAIHLQTQVQR